MTKKWLKFRAGSTDRRSESVQDFKKIVGPGPVQCEGSFFSEGPGPTGIGSWIPDLELKKITTG